jgi:hypothetical protein
MFSYLSSLARSGIVALAALSTVPIEASAAPIGRIAPAVAPVREMAPILVGQGEGLFIDGYRNGGVHWKRRHWRHHNRHWRRGFGPGIVLNFGIPSYRYRYYDDYYGEPIYRPRYHNRRIYRTRSAHQDWCYANYRSYRAWDNSWKPRRGPRRECVSPYY